MQDTGQPHTTRTPRLGPLATKDIAGTNGELEVESRVYAAVTYQQQGSAADRRTVTVYKHDLVLRCPPAFQAGGASGRLATTFKQAQGKKVTWIELATLIITATVTVTANKSTRTSSLADGTVQHGTVTGRCWPLGYPGSNASVALRAR